MRTVVLTGINGMEAREVPAPVISGSTDVLIKMKRVGVCGSDIHYYTTGRIGSQIVEYPFTVGHEGAGEVISVGKDVSRVKPGDRIAIEPAMPCFECDQCKAGRQNTCRNLKFLGCPGQVPGCLSEYIVIPETSCFPVPESISWDEAAISEPLTIGVYAVSRAMPIAQMQTGIFGFGPIGMSVLLAARTEDPGKIFVTDRVSQRLEKAMLIGAKYAGNPDLIDVEKKILTLSPEGLDIIFECCGKQEAMDNALHLLKPGGKLVLVGIPEFDHWRIQADIMRRHELTLINIRRQNHSLEKTLNGLIHKKYDVSTMPTHYFPLEKTKDAFDLVAGYNDGVMKAMIRFDD